MNAGRSPLSALAMLGREVFRMVALAAAENPPSLLAIAISAVVGFVLHAVHARPELVAALRLE